MATQLDAEEGKSSRSKASLTKINNKKYKNICYDTEFRKSIILIITTVCVQILINFLPNYIICFM